MDVKGTRMLVVGLARSGFAVARALAHRGAIVTVTDLKPPSQFRDLLPQLLKDKIGLELGSQRRETFLRHDVIVVSPGVPWNLPQLQAARQQKIPVYPEVEIATWFLEGTLVGVTGSNGKTTTTALLGDILRASGFPTFVGGNIGNPLSLAVDNAAPGTFFVTELSSFQLEGIQEFRPHVAVILNLSPNHLDRHPSFEAYAQAKRQILRNQRSDDIAVLNSDDQWVCSLRTSVRSRPVLFSRQSELPNGVFASGGKVYYRVRHLERVLFETRDVTLRGAFNLENVLAAAAAGCTLGADFTAIRRAVRDFRAVEHRLEFVREIQGVDYYNNSKATSVDATLKSLEAFERGVHLILGGKDKGAPYTPLLPLIKERVREVLLIGTAAPTIARDLAGSVELVQCGDLRAAVGEAFRGARPGDTVLLAPACSSFDQFQDYEERGRVFKELVDKLAWEVSPAARVRQQAREVALPEPSPHPEAAPPATEESPVLPAKEVVEPPAPETASAEGSPPQDQASGNASHEPATEKHDAENLPAPHHEPAGEDPTPSATVSPESGSKAGALGPEHAESEPLTSRCAELSYVYEVDVLETPPGETQLVPEQEAVISLADHQVEVASDDPLPFEVRGKGQPLPPSATGGVSSPKAKGKPGVKSMSRQSRLSGME